METWYNDTVTNTTALLSHVEDMNKSIYYTIQNPNPELADCEPTILKVEVKVGKANPQNYDYCLELEYIFMELLLLWFAKFWLSKIFERKTFFIAALFCRRVREHLGNKRELGFLYLRDEYKKEAKSFCSQRIQGALIAFCTFKTPTINQHTFSSFPEKPKLKKVSHCRITWIGSGGLVGSLPSSLHFSACVATWRPWWFYLGPKFEKWLSTSF